MHHRASQVVEAKAGAGSATLSMAAAAAEFADACIRGLLGEPGVVACAYVDSSLTELPFFASKCVPNEPPFVRSGCLLLGLTALHLLQSPAGPTRR